MASAKLIECSFLIPHHRDEEISDGERQPPWAWKWLRDEMYARFAGITIAPGIYRGIWKSGRTGKPIHDQTRKFIIALPIRRINDLRAVLSEACAVFEQQCIYLSVGGYVEFVEAQHDTEK